MLYLIDDKYYVKVGKDFTEVELVFTDNDVDLKPTSNIIENNGNIMYETINFLDKKQELIEKHKKEKPFNNMDNKSKSKYNSFE